MSRTSRNVSAKLAFLLLKDSRRALAARFASASAFLIAVLLGVLEDLGELGGVLLSRDMESDSVLMPEFGLLSSSSDMSKSLSSSLAEPPADFSLRGECWSIQWFVSVWFQKASTLSRWGVGGMRTFSFVGDLRRFRDGLDGGVFRLFSTGLKAGGEELRSIIELCCIVSMAIS